MDHLGADPFLPLAILINVFDRVADYAAFSVEFEDKESRKLLLRAGPLGAPQGLVKVVLSLLGQAFAFIVLILVCRPPLDHQLLVVGAGPSR